jgi:hypothetical protein
VGVFNLMVEVDMFSWLSGMSFMCGMTSAVDWVDISGFLALLLAFWHSGESLLWKVSAAGLSWPLCCPCCA